MIDSIYFFKLFVIQWRTCITINATTAFAFIQVANKLLLNHLVAN